MSNAIEKAADFSPTQLFILSALSGGAGFGGMRLLTDLSHQVAPPKPFNNSIKLQLPNPHKKEQEKMEEASMSSAVPPAADHGGMPKMADGEYNPAWLHKAMGVGIGLPMGFMGTKAVYDAYQSHQYQQKIEQAKKQYTDQLALAASMNKQSDHTPKVDELCQAMADEFEKNGDWKTPLKIGTGVAGLGVAGAETISPDFRHATSNAFEKGLHSAGNLAMGDVGKPPVVRAGPMIGHSIPVSHSPEDIAASTSAIQSNALSSGKHLIDKLLGYAPSATGDAMKALFGISTVGMLGMMLHNHSKKKEREQKAQYPTSIEYAN